MLSSSGIGSVRAIVVACACVLAMPAFAQEYKGPVKVLVGFAAGGSIDITARLLADKLKDTLGQPVVVENRPGAGGQIAAQALKAAPADGSTVMLSMDHTKVIIPLTFNRPGYEPMKDFVPLGQVARYIMGLAVHPSTRADSVKAYVEWAKSNPKQANIGIPAPGSVPHFAGYLVARGGGIELNSVPYKGAAPLAQDLIAGQIPAGIASVADFIEFHRAGKMRMIAVMGSQRTGFLPDVPTFEELGYKGLDGDYWIGFFAPAGTPRVFVERFNKAAVSAVALPDVRERLQKITLEAAPSTPDELGQKLSKGTAHWGPIIKASGFKPSD